MKSVTIVFVLTLVVTLLTIWLVAAKTKKEAYEACSVNQDTTVACDAVGCDIPTWTTERAASSFCPTETSNVCKTQWCIDNIKDEKRKYCTKCKDECSINQDTTTPCDAVGCEVPSWTTERAASYFCPSEAATKCKSQACIDKIKTTKNTYCSMCKHNAQRDALQAFKTEATNASKPAGETNIGTEYCKSNCTLYDLITKDIWGFTVKQKHMVCNCTKEDSKSCLGADQNLQIYLGQTDRELINAKNETGIEGEFYEWPRPRCDRYKMTIAAACELASAKLGSIPADIKQKAMAQCLQSPSMIDINM
jgi:hypothetical protein